MIEERRAAMRSHAVVLIRLLPVLYLVGCEPTAERVSGASQRDSAGVAILEASPPFESLTVDSIPSLRIGSVGGKPEYQFSKISYAGRLTDSQVVLIDGGSSEVRWYGPDGQFRSRAGGFGEGPGEFRRVASAALTDRDTLVVYDSQNQRLSWFSPEAIPSRTQRVELGPGSTIGLHSLDEGRLLIVEERPVPNFAGAEYNPARDSLLIMLVSGASAAVDTVMRLAGREAITWVDYVEGRPVGTRQMAVPFGYRAVGAGVADRITVVRAGDHQLALFGLDGELRRLVRRTDVDPPEVSASARKDFVEHAGDRWAGTPSEHVVRRGAEKRLDFVPEGRRRPAFDRLLADVSGHRIWVREFLPEWRSSEGRLWTVHDLDGDVLGRLATPPGLQVTQVTSDYLVGIETDDLGVEYVVLYSLN